MSDFNVGSKMHPFQRRSLLHHVVESKMITVKKQGKKKSESKIGSPNNLSQETSTYIMPCFSSLIADSSSSHLSQQDAAGLYPEDTSNSQDESPGVQLRLRLDQEEEEPVHHHQPEEVR